MLKGHVFSKQIFGNPIFALFINTFLDGKDGVSDNYKNGMKLTYEGNTITVDSGAACIQGRFLEEDTSTQIVTGNETAYCKLVIEINLDKQNTEEDFQQASYKVVKSASNYPNLTQTNIVKNNSGIYQYELARFKTNMNGISEFKDMRTFFNYDYILTQLEEKLASVEDGSAYLLKDNIKAVNGKEIEYISGKSINIGYPIGFNRDNTIILNVFLVHKNGYEIWDDWTLQLHQENIELEFNKVSGDINYLVYLMRI